MDGKTLKFTEEGYEQEVSDIIIFITKKIGRLQRKFNQAVQRQAG